MKLITYNLKDLKLDYYHQSFLFRLRYFASKDNVFSAAREKLF